MDKTFKFRLSGELDEKYGHAVAASEDPEATKSRIARWLFRWFAGETNELPRRPADN